MSDSINVFRGILLGVIVGGALWAGVFYLAFQFVPALQNWESVTLGEYEE